MKILCYSEVDQRRVTTYNGLQQKGVTWSITSLLFECIRHLRASSQSRPVWVAIPERAEQTFMIELIKSGFMNEYINE